MVQVPLVAMIWPGTCRSGRITGMIRKKILGFCVAARGAMIVANAGALAATTTFRIAGPAVSVFVAPGLLNFDTFTLLFFIAEGGRKICWKMY